MLPFMNTTQQTEAAVAQTILAQLGGIGRLTMMCGCKNFVAGNTNNQGVHFKVGTNGKKVSAMSIVLEANDTYTVKVWAGRGVNMKKVEELSEVYAEDLVRIFESATGMYLSF